MLWWYRLRPLGVFVTTHVETALLHDFDRAVGILDANDDQRGFVLRMMSSRFQRGFSQEFCELLNAQSGITDEGAQQAPVEGFVIRNGKSSRHPLFAQNHVP